MVTLIVAACILVPMDPEESVAGFMLEGMLLYLHTLCPLTMLAGCLISGGALLGARYAQHICLGPYFFFRIDQQPWTQTVMWMAVLVVGNFAIAWLLGKSQG